MDRCPEPDAEIYAFAALDSYIYGFALQEGSLAFWHPRRDLRAREGLSAAVPAKEYPCLAQLTSEHVLQPGYDYGEEYEFGLDLILHGLEELLSQQ